MLTRSGSRQISLDHSYTSDSEAAAIMTNPSQSTRVSVNESILDIVKQNKEILTELKTVVSVLQCKQAEIYDKLESLDNRVTNLDLRFCQQGKSIDVLHQDISDMKKKQNSIEGTVRKTENKVSQLENSVQITTDRLNKYERKSRENNLRIVGYPEAQNENVSQIVSNMLESKFNMNNVAIQNAHRTGKNIIFQGKKQPKHIIFKVLYLTDKIEIMKKKRQCLLDETYYITDDLTENDLDLKKRLKPVMDDAKANQKRWKFRNGKLIIEGQLYTGPIPAQSTTKPKVSAIKSKTRIEESKAVSRDNEWRLPPPEYKQQKRIPPKSNVLTTTPAKSLLLNEDFEETASSLGAVGGVRLGSPFLATANTSRIIPTSPLGAVHEV